jgi:hypothetical protein
MCSNIPASPAYGVYISQLIRYARASSNYSELSSNSRYKSKNDADEAVYVVSLTSSSGGYINGRNSANLELLIDKTSSNIPASPAYGVYISQLIRYARASSNYSDFLKVIFI